MVFALIVVVLIALIAIIVAVGNSKHNKKLQMELEQAWVKSDVARDFVRATSNAIAGIHPVDTSFADLFDQNGCRNEKEVQNALNFLYSIKSATSDMKDAESNSHDGSVARKATHIRDMVGKAQMLVTMVNETLNVNSAQMLKDLEVIEHRGNVSEIGKSVVAANDTLERIFGEFQKVNVQMAALGVSRSEAGISDSDPLAGFLDMAQKIADQKATEADLNSTDDEQSDTDDENN